MNPNMMKKLQKMQKDVQEAQEKIEMTEFTGRATGVVVVVQGTRQVIDVRIDDDLLSEKDILQDAILMAVNDALAQIEKTQGEVMGKFTGGMGGFGF